MPADHITLDFLAGFGHHTRRIDAGACKRRVSRAASGDETMGTESRIFNSIQQIRAASHLNVAYLGGSLTAAAGVGDASVTSWRRLFTRHLYERFHPVYHCQPMEVMAGIGAMESYGAVCMIERNITPHSPDLCFVEFCFNDRGTGDKKLVAKGVEGIIRQLKAGPTHPDVVLLGAGIRPDPSQPDRGAVPQQIHRELAEHYGCGFIDIQGFIWNLLEQRGLTWDHIAITFVDGDICHLNDYGNWMWFEALRQWFEAEWLRYDLHPTQTRNPVLPPPLHSDEMQFTRLVDPARGSRALTLAGSWEQRDQHTVPWYLDHVMVGRPGDKLTLRFTGTGLGAVCMIHCNGLKLEVRIDGREVPGCFTHFSMEFGKFFMLAHGLEYGEHVAEVLVGEPSPRRNRLADPTGQIGYLCVIKGRADGSAP